MSNAINTSIRQASLGSESILSKLKIIKRMYFTFYCMGLQGKVYYFLHLLSLAPVGRDLCLYISYLISNCFRKRSVPLHLLCYLLLLQEEICASTSLILSLTAVGRDLCLCISYLLSFTPVGRALRPLHLLSFNPVGRDLCLYISYVISYCCRKRSVLLHLLSYL